MPMLQYANWLLLYFPEDMPNGTLAYLHIIKLNNYYVVYD